MRSILILLSEQHCVAADFFDSQFLIQLLPPLGVIKAFPLNESNKSFSPNIAKALRKDMNAFLLYLCIGNHRGTSLMNGYGKNL